MITTTHTFEEFNMLDKEHGTVAPIVVDIAKAMQQMQENPELVAKMHELAFGPLAAQQLKVSDEIVDELVAELETARSILVDLEGWKPHHENIKSIDTALAKARGEV